MPDWQNIFEKLAGAAVSAMAGAQVGKWAGMESNEALREIDQFVQSQSVETIDSIDFAFTHAMAMQFAPESRVRMMQLYAWFKIKEFERFRRFRGFVDY